MLKGLFKSFCFFFHFSVFHIFILKFLWASLLMDIVFHVWLEKMENVSVLLLLSLSSVFGCTNVLKGYSWQFNQVFSNNCRLVSFLSFAIFTVLQGLSMYRNVFWKRLLLRCYECYIQNFGETFRVWLTFPK